MGTRAGKNLGKHFMWDVFLILMFAVTIPLDGIAQSNVVKTDNNYDCELPPLGLFRQVTGASWKMVDGFNETFVVDKKSDIRENRWTLSELDEIDPSYKFYLIRNPSRSGKEKCEPRMEVVGKLISPTGKLFDFKKATFDIPSRTLKFTTIERDGITYEVEANFYVHSRSVDGVFQKGTAKLKAFSKTLGAVLMEFPFTSWNFE